MRKIKILIEYFKLKHKGYTKENRMLVYAMKQYITFEEYEKYFNKSNELFINDYPKVHKLEQKASYDEILKHIPRID